MIPDSIKKLIQQAEQSKEAEEFWQEVNELAEKYEVPVDYILHEFY
jgi:hypothetical protein